MNVYISFLVGKTSLIIHLLCHISLCTLKYLILSLYTQILSSHNNVGIDSQQSSRPREILLIMRF